MASAKKIPGLYSDYITQQMDIINPHSTPSRKTMEYFKYYIALITTGAYEYDETFNRDLETIRRFINLETSKIEILEFTIRSYEKSRFIAKDEKFAKNENRFDYLRRVCNKTYLHLKRDEYCDFTRMIFDKFFELLYKPDLTFNQEVILVMVINTLEQYNQLRIVDSSEEQVDNEMFKFSS